MRISPRGSKLFDRQNGNAPGVCFLGFLISAGLIPASGQELEPDVPLRTTPLILREGGTPEQPALYDGQGLEIDLGKEVRVDEWKKQGDLWTSSPELLRDRQPFRAGQMAGLFAGNVPISIPRDLEAERSRPDLKSRCYVAPDRLLPGQMGYAEDGSIHFRWPEGIPPGSVPVILPAPPGTSCVSIQCSHLIVRNLTVRYSGNDGFNIHGDRIGIRLENVKAFCNADEGISAHGTVEMEVENAEVAWNGSVAGGVADVDESVTSYRNCRVHHNAGAAFFFSGKSHRVEDTVIHAQKKDFSIRSGTEVVRSGIDWRP